MTAAVFTGKMGLDPQNKSTVIKKGQYSGQITGIIFAC